VRRQSGISVPLFSLASSQGWGIGEFGDLPIFARWLSEAGQSIIQILPIQEMPPIETSPYSAMTAMAVDPIYITMSNVPDFAGIGGELALDGAEQAEVKRLLQAPRIDYAAIRWLKDKWLRRSFERFLRLEVSRGSPRAARFDAFVAAESWWLDEYALFRSLHAQHQELPWTRWPEPLSRADSKAIAEIREPLRSEMVYRSYLQWIAAEQWADAKRLSWPVKVFGDLPFMISADSPDVWARQHEFRFDATTDLTARRAAYTAFQKLWAEETPSVPLYYPSLTWALRAELQGVDLAHLGEAAPRLAQLPAWYLRTARVFRGW